MPVEYNHDHDKEITLFAETNFRNQHRRFGIKTDDRRRHMYILGKTGMGKTTLMENLFLSDVYAGHGCCYVDPHGDTAERLTDYIPSHRINDVVYFNPADSAYPMGFNILETENEDQKHLVVAGLMGVFKKIWPDVWSPRMEHILQNCVQALLDYPGSTLLGINRILVDKEFRAKVVAKIRDPVVKMFWIAEFASWSEKYATEAIAPIQNKVGQFLSSSIIRNIVAQVKSTINLKRIMDEGKILIVNLSKGRVGDDNMRLLGGMLITKIQLATQERQNYIPNEVDRRDFYLYVDEFQNFANESFATILSEARKYRLNLIVTHQYIEQLEEEVAAALFGNIGTFVCMRVGGTDAKMLETEFAPTFTPEDLVSLAKAQVYLKLMVDGVATSPFSANTLPPIGKRTGSGEKVILVCRERYAEPRAVIEEKVLRWSGMELALPPAATAAPTLSTPAGVNDASASLTSPLHYPAIKTEEELQAEQESREGFGQDTEGTSGEYLKLNPERLATITANLGSQKKKDKPKFPNICSRCGKEFFTPIQLDPSRPIYCPDVCRPLVLEERKNMSDRVRQVKQSVPPPEEAPAIAAPAQPEGEKPSAPAGSSNRPRIVRDESSAPEPREAVHAVREAAPVHFTDRLRQEKGRPFQTDKDKMVVSQERKREGEQHARRRRGGERGAAPPAQKPSTPPVSPAPSSPPPKKDGTRLEPGQHIRFDDET